MAEIPELLDPEAAPALDITLRAAPQVGKVAILAVTLGMILSVEAIVRGFFSDIKSSVGWIPFAGRVVTAPVTKIEQKVISFLSGLEADIDSAMGHAVHNTAVLINQLWHTLEASAYMAILWPQYLDSAIWSLAGRPFVRWVKKELRAIEAKIAHPVRTIVKIEKTIVRTVTRTAVTTRKLITVAVPKYIHRELLAIRHEAQHAVKANVRQDKEIKKLWRHVSFSAIAAVVAAVVGTAVLDAIKCSSLGDAFRKRGCSFWKDLEGLLSLFGEIFLFAHFCDLWAKAEPIFAFVLAPIVGVISTFADGACSHRPDSWETFGIQLHTPTPAEITQTLHIG